MTNIGVLAPLSEGATKVCDMLRNERSLKDARVHPFNILLALKQYQQGQGEKGKLTWTPNQAIVTALDEAFYLAFKVCIQCLIVLNSKAHYEFFWLIYNLQQESYQLATNLLS